MDGELLFGRGPQSPLPLDGSALSREHFSLVKEAGAVRIRDLSSNGTWVNGQRLGRADQPPLAPGAVIEIAGYRFHIRSIGAGASKPGMPPPASLATGPPVLKAAATSPVEAILAPVRGFWHGFTGLEKTMLFVAGCTAGLLLAYLRWN